jgi:Uma2 family endonuclease
MLLSHQRVTATDFNHYVALPENVGRNFELVAGEIVEKMVANPRSSRLGARVCARLTVFVEERGLGVVTGADGGYVVGEDQYIPDAAYIAKARQATQPSDAYNPLAPDLAVEVLSPSNKPEEMRLKIATYMAAGVLLWVIDPDQQRVEVYRSGRPPRTLGLDAVLDGEDVLPGFTLAVSSIFAD